VEKRLTRANKHEEGMGDPHAFCGAEQLRTPTTNLIRAILIPGAEQDAGDPSSHAHECDEDLKDYKHQEPKMESDEQKLR
jgi:hypothetical protein